MAAIAEQIWEQNGGDGRTAPQAARLNLEDPEVAERLEGTAAWQQLQAVRLSLLKSEFMWRVVMSTGHLEDPEAERSGHSCWGCTQRRCHTCLIAQPLLRSQASPGLDQTGLEPV